MTLVKLPNGQWVNPNHVTCVELEHSSDSKRDWTLLWVKKNSGYGTGSFTFEGDQRDAIAGLLNASVSCPVCGNLVKHGGG